LKGHIADVLRLTVYVDALAGAAGDLKFSPCPYPERASDAGATVPIIASCLEAPIPTTDWLDSELNDNLVSRTTFTEEPPINRALSTTFTSSVSGDSLKPGSRSNEIRDSYPYLNERGFTTSVEIPLDP
jgi:hypothetical protein